MSKKSEFKMYEGINMKNIQLSEKYNKLIQKLPQLKRVQKESHGDLA